MMISHKIKEGKPMTHIARDDAFTLLKKYNQDPFHIQHALTVEAVMKWYAKELGYGDDAEYWGYSNQQKLGGGAYGRTKL